MDRRILYAGLLVVAGAGLVRALRGPRVRSGTSRVLVVGDEHGAGLAAPLRAMAKDQKVQFDAITMPGSTIDQWARSEKLRERLSKFRPTMVLVSLGVNDDRLPGAEHVSRQAQALEQLLKLLNGSGAEVVWVGPPKTPWNSRGLVEMLRRTIARTHYFRSETLAIPRGPDGMTPTARGYAGWAGAVWRWVS